MKKPEVPADESERLRTLRAYDILDTEPEAMFDDIVRLASYIADTPIALISLVDDDRQWFKARVGLDAPQTSRDVSFCAHAVAEREMLVVPDALQDQRFADNPLVLDDPNIRFYAGALLTAPNAQPLGSLCVIDRVPREMAPEQLELLQALADQVVRLLELRNVAQKLRAANAESRAFFETSLDPLAIASFDGWFQALNPAWCDLLGFSMDELRRRPFGEFIHPDDLETVGNETAMLRSGDHATRNFVVRFLQKSGTHRWIQFSATADLEREIYIVVGRDVTERRAAEEALQRAMQAAQDANRAKSVFLANMSHELRTPLNSVIGFSNILLKNKEGTLEAKQLDYLSRIRRNGRHLLSLLNDVLDLSKIEVGRVEFDRAEVDLLEVVSDVANAVVEADRERFSLDVPETLQPVIGDRRRLEQIVTNLVGNALKFTPEGQVSVCIEAAEGIPVRLDVIDEGIGIEAENLDRIFEPFEQADAGTERRFGGTGLGLPISRSLARSMSFEVVATSRPGEGSTFSLLFEPDSAASVFAPKSERAGESLEQAAVSPGSGPVLIIDDEAESRLLLETAVADLGYAVVATDAPQYALAMAEAISPRAILLDLMMPEIDGFSILRRFQRHPTLCTVPVIIVSIVASENAGALNHAFRVMDKPVDGDALARALSDDLRRYRKVLVVDDDPDAREFVTDVAEELGAMVVEAADGAEALRLMAEQSFDAVVLDLNMPNVDGFEFVRRAQGDPKLRGVPIIVFTASEPSVRDSIHGFVTATLTKDGDLESLRSSLASVLE